MEALQQERRELEARISAMEFDLSFDTSEDEARLAEVLALLGE